MKVTYSCPQCEALAHAELTPDATELAGVPCGHHLPVPADAFEQGKLCRCVICPSTDLFVRKDFSQGLGVTIVAIGIVASSIAWGYEKLFWTYAILFTTALIDVVLYAFVPNALMCYRCGAHYRGVPELESFAAFNLETHERYRQQAARMAGKH